MSGAPFYGDELNGAEDRLTALLVAARQRLRDQTNQEKALLSLLNIDGDAGAASFSDRSAVISEQIKRERTLNDSIERFIGFIEAKEEASAATERTLRFPLALLNHLRTQNDWDPEAYDAAGHLWANQFQHKLQGNVLAGQAPNFVKLWQCSKALFKEVAFYRELKHYNFDPHLMTLQGHVEQRANQLAAMNADLALLKKKIVDEQREIENASEQRSKRAAEYQLWRSEVSANAEVQKLIAIENREEWVRKTHEIIGSMRVEAQSWTAKASGSRREAEGASKLHAETQCQIGELQRQLDALRLMHKEMEMAAHRLEASSGEEMDALSPDNGEREELEKQLSVLEAALADEKEKLNNARTQLSAVEADAKLMTEEQKVMKQKLEHVRADYAQVQAELHQLTKDAESAEKELKHFSTTASELVDEIQYLALLHPLGESILRDCSQISAEGGVFDAYPPASRSDILARARDARRRLHFNAPPEHPRAINGFDSITPK